MKRIILLFLYSFVSNISFSQETQIPISVYFAAYEEIGVRETSFGNVPNTLMNFSQNSYISIADRGLYKFLVLSKDMKIIRRINVEGNNTLIKLLLSANNAKMNVFNEIIGVSFNGPLVCMTPTGKIKFSIDVQNMNGSLKDDLFWLYKEYIIYDTGNANPGLITRNGHILSGNELSITLKELRSESDYFLNSSIKNKILEFLQENKAILCGNSLFPLGSFVERREIYFNFIALLREEYHIDDSFNFNSSGLKDNMYHVMTDYHNNMYFRLSNGEDNEIIIFTKNGRFLKRLSVDEFPAIISPWGDGYGFGYDKDTNQYIMKRYINTWDPILDEDILEYINKMIDEEIVY